MSTNSHKFCSIVTYSYPNPNNVDSDITIHYFLNKEETKKFKHKPIEKIDVEYRIGECDGDETTADFDEITFISQKSYDECNFLGNDTEDFLKLLI